MYMFCKKCGNRIEEGDVFCQSCGMKLKRDDMIPDNNPMPSFTEETPDPKSYKGQKVSSVIFGIIGVVIVVLIGGIGWGGYKLYKLNRDIDGVASSVSDVDTLASGKNDFENFTEIQNDTFGKAYIGYNSDSILDSLTLMYENNGNTLRRSREVSDFTVAKASSALEPTSHSTYYPEHVLDGNKNTAWIEGAKGFGEGEWIELSADSAHKVYGLCIRNGCTKEEKRLIKNAQAKKIQVEFSDGSSNEFELGETQNPDQECSNVLLFTDGPVETEKIRIKILSVYESQDYVDPATGEFFARDLDMAISDIYVLQWDEEKGMQEE